MRPVAQDENDRPRVASHVNDFILQRVRFHSRACAEWAASCQASTPGAACCAPTKPSRRVPFPMYYLRRMGNDRKDLKRPITYWIGEGGGWLLQHVVTGLAATGITPNMFTFFALGVNSCAAALLAMGQFRSAAGALFLAAFLDMADGQVARRVGQVTSFGAFLDSTLDRYSDLGLYMGLVVYYTLIGRTFYMALAAVAMASSFMVSYSRARAESLIPSCKVGFM